MYSGDGAGGDRGKNVPQAFPSAETRHAFVSYVGGSNQGSRLGAAPNPSTNAVTTPWTSVGSSEGRFRERDMGKNISAEKVQEQPQGFSCPEHSYQQRTMYTQGDSRVTSVFPAIKEEWDSEQNSLYPSNGFLNGNENSVKKVHDIGSSMNSHSLEFLQQAASTQNACSFYYDPGARSRLEAMLFHPQRGHFHPVATSSASIHHMDLHQGVASEDNKTHALTLTEHKSPPTGDTLLPPHKRKVIQQDCLWNSNVAVEQYQPKDYHFPAPPAHGNKLSEQNVPQSAVISRQLPKFGPESNVGCQPVVHPCNPHHDVKEQEEKEWTRLLRKEVTKSDVGSLGRIVLPKKEAEVNLPPLLKKEGFMLYMMDMAHDKLWRFRYRYWPNNRSRMYVLENTGDFARMNNLEIGDSIVIYRRGASRRYRIGVIKKATPKRRIAADGASNQPLRDDNKAEQLSSDQQEGSSQPNTSQVPKQEAVPLLMGFPLNSDSGSSSTMPQLD